MLQLWKKFLKVKKEKKVCQNIYRLLFVCFLLVCLFVRLRISPTRIKLAAPNFARLFIGVQGRESPIFVNFAPPEAQNWTSRPARYHLHDVHDDYPLTPEHMIARRVHVGSACVYVLQVYSETRHYA